MSSCSPVVYYARFCVAYLDAQLTDHKLINLCWSSYVSIVADCNVESVLLEISLRTLGVVTRQPVTLTQPNC